MAKYKIDYTLKDGRKRRCYIEAVPGTPIVALISKAGLYAFEGITIRKVSEVRKVA